ncbi:hypothetical protein MKEN_01043000 [Mycena kentingensis (nom. inval.)]|nr:hypothetical protein MKEN_01043000 [Mycena kentingensis (nom. inval.)]
MSLQWHQQPATPLPYYPTPALRRFFPNSGGYKQRLYVGDPTRWMAPAPNKYAPQADLSTPALRGHIYECSSLQGTLDCLGEDVFPNAFEVEVADGYTQMLYATDWIVRLPVERRDQGYLRGRQDAFVGHGHGHASAAAPPKRGPDGFYYAADPNFQRGYGQGFGGRWSRNPIAYAYPLTTEMSIPHPLADMNRNEKGPRLLEWLKQNARIDSKEDPVVPRADSAARVFHPPPIGTRSRTSSCSDSAPDDDSEPYRLIPSILERFPWLRYSDCSDDGSYYTSESGSVSQDDDEESVSGDDEYVFAWPVTKDGEGESTCYDDETRRFALEEEETARLSDEHDEGQSAGGTDASA